MGYELRRQVRDAIPPGLLTSAERLLLLEIADYANDGTRQGWPGSDELSTLADVSVGSISTLLNRIAEKWMDFRVAIGKDAKGRPVYARKGHRTIFRFPPSLPRWDDGCTLRSDDGPTLGAEGETTGQPSLHLEGERWDDGSTKGGTVVHPFSSGPLKEEPHLSSGQSATAVTLAEHGIADDEREPFTRWIEKSKNVHTPDGWIIAAGRNGTLASRVAEWRATLAPNPIRRGAGDPWSTGQLDTKPADRHPFEPDGAGLSCTRCSLPAQNARHTTNTEEIQ